MIATLISISRTCDYHHHYTDVLAGGIIGILVAYLCYRQYYPAFDSKLSHLPHPRRSNQDRKCVVNGQEERSSSETCSNGSEKENKKQTDRRSAKNQSGSESETKALF